MHIVPSVFSVAQYCQEMADKTIVVNREYQRSDRVWPEAARKFLIDTIIQGYPMPKLSLFQVTDPLTFKTVKEIVDGQQRSLAILAFRMDDLALPRHTSIEGGEGKLFSQLPREHQMAFLEYGLSVDVFLSATREQIREVFRRINSYTVPLNPEENRHAVYQGPFKWFMYDLSRRYSQIMVDIGAFGDRQLVRMADVKLYCEIVHALLFGITTTSKRSLDNLYGSLDADFAVEEELRRRFEHAVSTVVMLTDLHGGAMVRPHNLYALLLAIMHVNEPVSALGSAYQVYEPQATVGRGAVERLSVLAAAIEAGTVDERFRNFVTASSSKTNVKDNRTTRFRVVCEALTGR